MSIWQANQQSRISSMNYSEKTASSDHFFTDGYDIYYSITYFLSKIVKLGLLQRL